MCRIESRIDLYREHARSFYFQVVLGHYPCPRCGGALTLIAPSRCRCACGVELDPTLEFQRSTCCDAKLRRARTHYVCSACNRIAPSRFLFDERIFDSAYFAASMRESRERKQKQIEVFRRMIEESRSEDWQPEDTNIFKALSDLGNALDACIHTPIGGPDILETYDDFSIPVYRRTIVWAMGGDCIRFEALPALSDNTRLDRVRRFMTLLFMEQDREIILRQQADGILVTPYETDQQGQGLPEQIA